MVLQRLRLWPAVGKVLGLTSYANSPKGAVACGASFAFTRATSAAVHTAAPAGVDKPRAVGLAASAPSDSEPSG